MAQKEASMKNWRNVAILGLFLLALGGIASWDEWQSKKDKEAESSKNKITALKVDEIDELEYKRVIKTETNQDASNLENSSENGRDPSVDIKIVKKNGTWQLTNPFVYPGDASTIEALLKTLTDYAYTQEIPVGKDRWAEFGLDQPQQIVTLKSSNNPSKTFTIYVGSKAPIGYNVYFRTSTEEKVFMGSQHLLVSSNKSLFDFRDKRVVTLDENSVSSIRYERLGQATIELKKINGIFSLFQPEESEADQSEVKDFLANINSIKAHGIEDQPQADLINAFSRPEITVTLTQNPSEIKAIKFINYGSKFAASYEPDKRVYFLSEESVQKINRELISFRNRRILSTDLLNVKLVEIDGTSYEFINGSWYSSTEAAKFKIKSTGDRPDSAKEEAHIRALMVDLEFAKTDKFYTSKDKEVSGYLEKPPLHRIKITYSDAEKVPLVLEMFSANDNDKYLVRRSDKPSIFRVPRSTFYSMTPNQSGKEESKEDSSALDDLPVDETEDSKINLSTPTPPPHG